MIKKFCGILFLACGFLQATESESRRVLERDTAVVLTVHSRKNDTKDAFYLNDSIVRVWENVKDLDYDETTGQADFVVDGDSCDVTAQGTKKLLEYTRLKDTAERNKFLEGIEDPQEVHNLLRAASFFRLDNTENRFNLIVQRGSIVLYADGLLRCVAREKRIETTRLVCNETIKMTNFLLPRFEYADAQEKGEPVPYKDVVVVVWNPDTKIQESFYISKTVVPLLRTLHKVSLEGNPDEEGTFLINEKVYPFAKHAIRSLLRYTAIQERDKMEEHLMESYSCGSFFDFRSGAFANLVWAARFFDLLPTELHALFLTEKALQFFHPDSFERCFENHSRPFVEYLNPQTVETVLKKHALQSFFETQRDLRECDYLVMALESDFGFFECPKDATKRNCPVLNLLTRNELCEILNFGDLADVLDAAPEEGKHFLYLHKSKVVYAGSKLSVSCCLLTSLKGIDSKVQDAECYGDIVIHFTLLRTVPTGAFAPFVNLEKLALCCNKITILGDNAFGQLVRLKELNLSHNSLTGLRPDTFAGIPNLQILLLSHNQIAGLDRSVFEKVGSLKKLDLSSNEFSDAVLFLEPRGYGPDWLGNLRELSLRNNKITTIGRSFIRFPDFEVLDLGENKITKIVSNAFCLLYKLKKLDISANLLAELDSGMLSGTEALEELDCSKNPLKTLNPYVVGAMKGLKKAHFNDTRISQVQPGTFTGMASLEFVDLKNTKILATASEGSWFGVNAPAVAAIRAQLPEKAVLEIS